MITEVYKEKLRARILEECKARGLPAWLDLGKNASKGLKLIDYEHSKKTGEHVMLLAAEGWAKYSSRFMGSLGFYGLRRGLAILGGHGREGVWAARVPASYSSVQGALAWLKPAVVRKAEQSGRKVLRQGDVWIVELRLSKADNLSGLPSSHVFDPETRTLSHDGHGVLHVPFPFVAIPQRTLAADGRRRRRGD